MSKHEADSGGMSQPSVVSQQETGPPTNTGRVGDKFYEEVAGTEKMVQSFQCFPGDENDAEAQFY